MNSDKPDFAAVFSGAPVGLALLERTADGKLHISVANQTFSNLVGGEAVSSMPKLVSLLDKALDELMQIGRQPARLELSFIASSGRPVICQVAINPLSENSFVVTADDITNLKAAEQQMLETVGVEQREDFIATLTHDLKTPIVGANMVLAALLDGTLGQLTEGQSGIISKLLTSNQALLKMIQNLLEVYKYESGSESLAMEHVDLVPLVKSCAEDVRPLLENKSLSLELDFGGSGKIELVCDQYAMQRVLVNLLGNAVKFTPHNGRIKVSVSLSEDQVSLQVMDTGSGIALSDQPKLFQRFFQGEPGRRYAAGIGLGLYFCNHVVRAHKGTIVCESTPGMGTTFTICLPTGQS